MRRNPLFEFVGLVIVATLVACSSAEVRDGKQPVETPEEQQPVEVRVIAFNDFHGHLVGPSGTVDVGDSEVQAGGVDALAAHVARLSAEKPHSTVVIAGDLIGASPLVSALFHDEPTIEAMNLVGLDILALGNHEFDEGVEEIKRIKNGGCHPEDGCHGPKEYEGAQFDFLAANVIVRETDQTLFPANRVMRYGDHAVGFIGLTLEGTPDLVSPAAIASVRFRDEIETIDEQVAILKKEGVEAIVVLIHEGGLPTSDKGDVDACPGISGPIVEIVEGVDDSVDAFVTGHTHQAYNCVIDKKRVTSAKSYGRVLTTLDMVLDPETGDVRSIEARNHPVTRDIEPHERLAAHIATYQKLVQPLAERKVGMITEALSAKVGDNGASELGRIIADAQLEATQGEDAGRAQIALMNPGGIRASIEYEGETAEDKGVVTYEELHRVQPFGNTLVTMSLTGAQIEKILERQWKDQAHPKVLQVSHGFSYAWDPDGKPGDRVDPKTIQLDGKTLDPKATYRVTVNSFLATGGDGFETFSEGTDRTGGPLGLDALVDYVARHSPVEPVEKARINLVK
jgi:5'-nucleotidase